MSAREAPRAGSMARENRVDLGRIARPHGLDGTLLAVLYGDDAANLEAASEITLEGGPGSITFRVLAVAPGGQTESGRLQVKLRLAGLDDRGSAEAWRGAAISIAEDQLLPLPEGEYYWRDLIGLLCQLPDGTRLGRVEEIWPTGSNDVLVVRSAAGTRLIPALDEVLVMVDLDAGLLTVDPPEGLLDTPPEEA